MRVRMHASPAASMLLEGMHIFAFLSAGLDQLHSKHMACIASFPLHAVHVMSHGPSLSSPIALLLLLWGPPMKQMSRAYLPLSC